jgi:hypothetical protein
VPHSTTGDLNWVPPRPIKLLSYADDVLLFIKTKAEFVELQKCLKVYNKASNSKINYKKSVAFPLHGGNMKENGQGAILEKYIVDHQKMRWYNRYSSGYLKYLGYPICFSTSQRDEFYEEMKGKMESQLWYYRSRQLSMYGRAHVANVMILSKLWHILRILPVTKGFLQDVNSLIYQFIVSGIFPKLKGSLFFLPKEKGGLGLMNVEAQQRALQLRYIKALLRPTGCEIPEVPLFLYDLMVGTLQVSFKTPCHEIPLLIKSSRRRSALHGLHPFATIFDAMDSCTANLLSSSIHWKEFPSAQTCLLFPIIEIFDIPDGQLFTFSKDVLSCKVQDFFEYDNNSRLIIYKERRHCLRPNVLSRIRRAVVNNEVSFKSFFKFHTQNGHDNRLNSQEEELEYRASINIGINLEPLMGRVKHQGKSVFGLTSKQIRMIMLDDMKLQYSRSINTTISPQFWRSFTKSPMHYSGRNLWYRLIHKKMSNKSTIYKDTKGNLVEDDRCTFCGLIEDAKHMLFVCHVKEDIWNGFFARYIAVPKSVNFDRLFSDISNLKLPHYMMSNLDLKVNIYNLFGTCLRMIWRSHWQHYFNNIPFDEESVNNQITTELQKLSSFYYIN